VKNGLAAVPPGAGIRSAGQEQFGHVKVALPSGTEQSKCECVGFLQQGRFLRAFLEVSRLTRGLATSRPDLLL
jgi:hypothetical protein